LGTDSKTSHSLSSLEAVTANKKFNYIIDDRGNAEVFSSISCGFSLQIKSKQPSIENENMQHIRMHLTISCLVILHDHVYVDVKECLTASSNRK
jgi:hypothetical protein